MSRLPVIVGFGGINPAGRSSFHHGYRRMVLDALGSADADATLRDLARLMGLGAELTPEVRQQVLDGTLVRRLEKNLFDADNIPWNKRMTLQAPVSFTVAKRQLPERLPADWQLTELDAKTVQVTVAQDTEVLVPTTMASDVNSAGQLPSGFEPERLYQARSHPRGLAMTIYGASDALGSTGFDWDLIAGRVSPDMISVYAGSGMSQLDGNGNGGMMAARANGKRVTSKHCPFGFAEMPADFINAYVLGSLGNTGTSMGACASFLYNLRMGIQDIQAGRARVAIVGNAEAAITPEVIEGYSAMGALATDAELLALDADKGATAPDHRRAVRPFSQNCGFTLGEAAQFIVLMDDALALELGAQIFGAVGDVFVNADGYKKSISAPGVGNYITMAKAVAAARAVVGEEGIRRRSFVQAHGTSTPQNRVTESHILNETAKAFGIERWPVAAVKCFLGHSIGVAAGDQIAASLGVWRHGLVPGIKTIEFVADDVHHSNLWLDNQHKAFGADGIDTAIINAKGFGGNNASAYLLAPHIVEAMLGRKHGAEAMRAWRQRSEAVAAAAADYDRRATAGEAAPVYKFDHNVLHGEDVSISGSELRLKGIAHAIDLQLDSPYGDML